MIEMLRGNASSIGRIRNIFGLLALTSTFPLATVLYIQRPVVHVRYCLTDKRGIIYPRTISVPPSTRSCSKIYGKEALLSWRFISALRFLRLETVAAIVRSDSQISTCHTCLGDSQIYARHRRERESISRHMCGTSGGLIDEGISEVDNPNHEKLVLWILDKVKVNPSRQTAKTVHRQLATLETTPSDLLCCLRLLAAMQWNETADHAADTLLRSLGELLDDTRWKIEVSEEKDGCDEAAVSHKEVREELKRLARELVRDTISAHGGGEGMYLHPKAVVKMLRLSRCLPPPPPPPAPPACRPSSLARLPCQHHHSKDTRSSRSLARARAREET